MCKDVNEVVRSAKKKQGLTKFVGLINKLLVGEWLPNYQKLHQKNAPRCDPVEKKLQKTY